MSLFRLWTVEIKRERQKKGVRSEGPDSGRSVGLSVETSRRRDARGGPRRRPSWLRRSSSSNARQCASVRRRRRRRRRGRLPDLSTAPPPERSEEARPRRCEVWKKPGLGGGGDQSVADQSVGLRADGTVVTVCLSLTKPPPPDDNNNHTATMNNNNNFHKSNHAHTPWRGPKKPASVEASWLWLWHSIEP